MQLDAFAEPVGSCGKTSLEPSAQTAEQTLLSWLGKWLEPSYLFRETDGDQPALVLAKTDLLSGACWTRSFSEWPRDAAVCSLSSILETGEVDPRFYLSQRACAGILRRAEKRGKELPATLVTALEAMASTPARTEPGEGRR
jgi:hypothetical protein